MSVQGSPLSAVPRTTGRWAALRATAQARWQALAPRERLMVTLAAWAVGLTLLWLLGIQQPLQAGQAAQARLARLDEQWLVMQRQAAEAQALKAVAPLPAGQAEQALQAATARLGPRGRLARQGDRAVLSVEGASASELQAWWFEARAGARARPVEMQLARNERGLTGTLTVSLGETP